MTITMMPDIAERIGVPRALGVELPFGHTLGHAGSDDEHRTVLSAALMHLEGAEAPNAVTHLDLEWPNPEGDWHKRWQPREPAPIVKALRGDS